MDEKRIRKGTRRAILLLAGIFLLSGAALTSLTIIAIKARIEYEIMEIKENEAQQLEIKVRLSKHYSCGKIEEVAKWIIKEEVVPRKADTAKIMFYGPHTGLLGPPDIAQVLWRFKGEWEGKDRPIWGYSALCCPHCYMTCMFSI